MVEQKDIDLNKPLDESAPATLSKSTLTPNLTRATTTLHGDRFKQAQAQLSRFVLLHPIAVSVYTIFFPSIIGRSLWEYIEISDTAQELFWLLVRNKRDFVFALISAIPIIAAVFATFGTLAYFLGDELGTIANQFVQKKYCDQIFGFNVREFASIEDDFEGNSNSNSNSNGNSNDDYDGVEVKTKEKNNQKRKLNKSQMKANLEKGKNSEVVSYRGSPIAVASVVPDYEQSKPDYFIIKITGVHVRKVFQKVDFDQMLIEWAVLRSRQLYQDFLKNGHHNTSRVKDGSILITIDAYSFDKHFEKLLAKNGFKAIDVNYTVNALDKDKKVGRIYELLYKLFGISTDTFALILSTSNEDVELIKDSQLLKDGSSK